MDLTPLKEKKPLFNPSSTPIVQISRKRKHDESLDFSLSPKFSSTLNESESLITDLKDICLVGSVHNTPEKQRSLIAKPVVSSPIQETRKLLYNSLKIVKPERERRIGLLRNRNTPSQNHLLNKILNINVIMDVIFKHLSGGDLYRFSLVSQSFYRALEKNCDAFARYQMYRNNYKDNKENYVITPPGSPEKCDSPPRTSSASFNRFIRLAKCLSKEQSLDRCRKCGDAAVVDNDICQCQNLSCGLIYCRRCSSSSETGAKDFVDACGHAVLRPTLGNMSNLDDSFFNISNFSTQDSGFYSECESPPKVKRNLFMNKNDTPKILSVNNKNKHKIFTYRKNSLSCVPVIPSNDPIRKPLDCDSPPRLGYAVGSRQSKKNLKRLTR